MITPLDESTKKRIGRLLAKTVSQYFQEEEHRREFEEWYFDKYGVKYQWKFGGASIRQQSTENDVAVSDDGS